MILTFFSRDHTNLRITMRRLTELHFEKHDDRPTVDTFVTISLENNNSCSVLRIFVKYCSRFNQHYQFVILLPCVFTQCRVDI